MPEELKAQLRSETFAERASVAALPAPVREGLAVLFRSPGLEMADPGEPFQVTDVVVGRILPARRLGVAGCSPRHCVVYYERGGIAHTWSAVVFDAGGAPARFLWGGSAPRGLAGVEAVRRALLDGSVTGRSDYW